MFDVIERVLFVVGLCLGAYKFAHSADIDEWQQQRLFNPSQSLLMAEANGHITIYDGIPVETVERAMDQQFRRIDSMMFTRIRHQSPAGETVEDDGC